MATDRIASWLQRLVVVLLVALVLVGVFTFLRSGKSEAKPPADAAIPAASYIAESALPAAARSTIARIDSGGPFPDGGDGTVFANGRHVLPTQAAGYYHRYGVSDSAFLVQGTDGALYYSTDGRTFRQVRR